MKNWFAGFGLPFSAAVAAHPYYNSAESGCNGSDPNVLFCDDFETDNNGLSPGTWFYDAGITPRNKGWGSSYPANPAPAARCGSSVTPFGSCAADAGRHSGIGQGANMALHLLKTSTCGTDGTQFCGVNEIYVRWYAKWDPGYLFGQEKHMTITNSDGDIAFTCVVLNCGGGDVTGTVYPNVSINYGSFPNYPNCGPQNQGNSIGIVPGRWYFFEEHVRVGSNAIIELWINDCGVDGRSCGTAPVLRTRYINGTLPGNRNGSLIETVWPESWANPASIGIGPVLDQIKASRVGPIGFAGGITSPSPPPDTSPPAVAIVSPANGAVVPLRL
jgi:hypothetical protein